MRWRQSFSTILVGKSILLREGLAGILHSADFHILASVSCADDFPQAISRYSSSCLSSSIPAMILPPQSSKSNFSGNGTRVLALRSWPITIG